MKPIQKLLVLLLGGLLSLVALNAFSSANAEEKEIHWGAMPDEDGDGLVEEVFVYSDGKYLHFVIIYSADDTEFSWWENNPDGDSGGTDPDGLQDAINHAKNSGGGDVVVERTFEDSPVGSTLESQGEGPSTVWNPGDDGDEGGGGNPMAGIDEQEVLDLGSGSASEGQIEADAGSPSQQVKDNLGGGSGNVVVAGGNDDGDVVDMGPGKDDDPAWMHFGPIVNPNPDESSASSERSGAVTNSEVEQEEEFVG